MQLTPWDSDAPDTWTLFQWPTWVPTSVRRDVEAAWPEGPRAWLRNWRECGAPRFGSTVSLVSGGYVAMHVTGRFVHVAHGQGRVVHYDGTWESGSYAARAWEQTASAGARR